MDINFINIKEIDSGIKLSNYVDEFEKAYNGKIPSFGDITFEKDLSALYFVTPENNIMELKRLHDCNVYFLIAEKYLFNIIIKLLGNDLISIEYDIIDQNVCHSIGGSVHYVYAKKYEAKILHEQYKILQLHLENYTFVVNNEKLLKYFGIFDKLFVLTQAIKKDLEEEDDIALLEKMTFIY